MGRFFRFGGKQSFCECLLPNDKEDTTEDIWSVLTGYMRESLRFIKNFVSLCFWSKIKKNMWCRHVSIFQIWGEQIFGEFMLWKDTEDTIEDILSVRTGYISESLNFWKNFVSLCFWSKVQKICDAGITKFSDFGSTNFGWFYGFKWYRKDYWTQFICVGWVNEQKFEIYWEFCKFEFLVQSPKNL